ncbi:phage BR0599 family protein [Roseibium sediminis]|uniref:phage BR0599 family protein n=1 Tax=Roseibium sediminis TaxID=1775174 RepID=UPI00123CF9CA|nr:phage BR0599 family protein [Roseibium sediminis]
MTFDSLERSNASGLPVALYEFSFGTKTWRYCNGEDDIVINGVTYTGIAISDGGVVMSGDADADELVVTMPSAEDVAVMMNGTPPSNPIWLNVRNHHRDDSETPIVWVGYVHSSKTVDGVTAEIACRMLTASFDSGGLRLAYGRQCPHAVYDVSCSVNKSSFGQSITVDAVVGNMIVSDDLLSLPDGYLSNGFFSFARFDGSLEQRAIENHSGNRFIVLGSGDGLIAGDFITAYPGCRRTRADCKNKFNNLANFGGFPHLPGTSPFQGDPVF